MDTQTLKFKVTDLLNELKRSNYENDFTKILNEQLVDAVVSSRTKIDDISLRLKINERTLNKATKEHFGLTPSTLIKLLKCHLASLLSSTNTSHLDAIRTAGFRNVRQHENALSALKKKGLF
jgi:AraC-like DNA-binding protein